MILVSVYYVRVVIGRIEYLELELMDHVLVRMVISMMVLLIVLVIKYINLIHFIFIYTNIKILKIIKECENKCATCSTSSSNCDSCTFTDPNLITPNCDCKPGWVDNGSNGCECKK